MRVLLSTYGGRGDVEPIVGLAVRLQELGAEVLVCGPEDCADRLAEVDLPLKPIGFPVRSLLHGATPPAVESVPQRAAELIAAQFEQLPAVAEGCDALVATGLFPVAAGAQSVAEKLRIRYVYGAYCPIYLPSPYQRPQPLPGRPVPPEVTDRQALNDLDVQNYNRLFGGPLNTHRAAIGLPHVDNVRDHVITGHPWLAADQILGPWQETPNLDVVQTGAWILPDERPLPVDLAAFLDAGAPPVYVGFGSMPMRAPGAARLAIAAVRAHGHRVVLSRGWADLALIDDADDCFAVGEVNHHALFRRVAAVVHHGGAGTTTTAARAGAPQVVVPQMADQPYWAGRVAELGIGVAHDGSTPTTESLSAALEAALTAATRARANDLAGTVRSDGAAVAARLLVDAIGEQTSALSA